ncbi:hypothetical protein ABBQ38_010653 [Trebouxia sp. C0009 RCD-2024]
MSAKSPVLVQRSFVQPANRTFSEPDRIKLCNFDMKSPTLNERIAVVFAFPGHLAADALVLSLRSLLDRYPACCGRLSIGKGEGFLVCNSAGVPVWEMCQEDAADTTGAAFARLASPFTQDINPRLLQQGAEALMKIQITHCGEDQTLLGVTMAHVLADVGGLINFLKDWMSLHMQRGTAAPQPLFARNHVYPVKQLSRQQSSISQQVVTVLHFCTTLFVYLGLIFELLLQGGFSQHAPTILLIPLATLQGLKDRLNHSTMAGPYDMSSNDLLCSILWHVTCMVRQRSESDTGKFYVPLDLRQMHAPDAYFGNAHCVQSITDPDRQRITKRTCREEEVTSVALTARVIKQAVVEARESKKSAQLILYQLEQLSLPLLGSVNSSLQMAVTYDGALSSWQELYRLVSCLDFGTGLATGCATLQSDRDLQPWAGWWGQNPLTGEAYLHVNVPPGKQAAFKSCHLWNALLPGAEFL